MQAELTDNLIRKKSSRIASYLKFGDRAGIRLKAGAGQLRIPVYGLGGAMAEYFSLEKANETLGQIRPMIAELLALRQEVLAKQPRVWPVVEKAAGNGGAKAASELVRNFNRIDELVKAINATGAILKDINSGLVDFLALRDKQEIYFCWRFDEPEILFWHDIQAGFVGRQPI